MGVIKISYADIQKRIRRRKIRFRIIMSLILISIIVVFLFKTPVFKVTKVIVKGNIIVDSENIEAMSGINVGDNLLRLNTKYIVDSVLANPYIETCTLKRLINGNVYITVTERHGSAMIKWGKKYITIDKKGAAIEILDKIDGINLPVIEGLDIKNAQPGRIVEVEDARKLDAFIEIFDIITNNDLSGIINKVDIKNLLSISLNTKYDIRFEIGDNLDMDYKIKICKTIMEQDVRKKSLKGTIDVSIKDKPIFRLE